MTVLNPDELVALTKRSRRDAQCAELRHMGITHAQRRDGSVVVLWSAVDKSLGGAARPKKSIEPNWEAAI